MDGNSIAVARVDGGVLAGRISVIADALPQIISMSLLGLCADDRAGRSADDCAGSRAARPARQQAAEYSTDDSASDCSADYTLARRRRRRTRRRRYIFGAWRRRRDLFDRWICIFDIRNDVGRSIHRMIVKIPIAIGHPPIAASSETTFVWPPMPACPRSAFAITPEASVVNKVRSSAGSYSSITGTAYRVARSDYGVLSGSNYRMAGSHPRVTSNCRALWLNRLSFRGWLFICLFFRQCRERHCSKNRHQQKGNQ